MGPKKIFSWWSLADLTMGYGAQRWKAISLFLSLLSSLCLFFISRQCLSRKIKRFESAAHSLPQFSLPASQVYLFYGELSWRLPWEMDGREEAKRRVRPLGITKVLRSLINSDQKAVPPQPLLALSKALTKIKGSSRRPFRRTPCSQNPSWLTLSGSLSLAQNTVQASINTSQTVKIQTNPTPVEHVG